MLATVVWSIARLSNALPKFLDIVPLLVEQIRAVAKDMNSQEVSNSLWAAANLAQSAPDVVKMVPALVCQAVVAKEMKPQNLSNSSVVKQCC